MKKLIARIIAFFKSLKNSLFQEEKIYDFEIETKPKPSQRSAAHQAYYNYLKARLKKANKNKSKRYASTKGF